jgi:iron complex transport system ATP-binding protein
MSCNIEVENLSFGYEDRKEILKNLNITVKSGTFLAIAGPNGAGKTTLLNLLSGLLNAEKGIIKINGLDINSYSVRKLAHKIAFIPQEFVPLFDFCVAETVAMARTPYLGTFGFESKADMEIVDEALKMTDTAQFASRPLARLSGGERQRVFIARAIAQNTPVLLLDEPTSFLDMKHQVAVYDLLKMLQLEKSKTIIAVTHDINLAAQYADEILLLTIGDSYHYGRTKDVFSAEQIKNVFGVKTFTGKIGQENFFIPLGNFAKDKNIID